MAGNLLTLLLCPDSNKKDETAGKDQADNVRGVQQPTKEDSDEPDEDSDAGDSS